MWARGDYEGIGLDGSRMIGVGSFDQRDHRLDGTIVAARGCTGRTFEQSVDDQTEVLVAALDRLSSEGSIAVVTGSKQHLEEKAELLEPPEKLEVSGRMPEKWRRVGKVIQN